MNSKNQVTSAFTKKRGQGEGNKSNKLSLFSTQLQDEMHTN